MVVRVTADQEPAPIDDTIIIIFFLKDAVEYIKCSSQNILCQAELMLPTAALNAFNQPSCETLESELVSSVSAPRSDVITVTRR